MLNYFVNFHLLNIFRVPAHYLYSFMTAEGGENPKVDLNTFWPDKVVDFMIEMLRATGRYEVVPLELENVSGPDRYGHEPATSTPLSCKGDSVPSEFSLLGHTYRKVPTTVPKRESSQLIVHRTTSAEPPPPPKKKKKTNKKGKKTKAATPWIWGPEQQQAFDLIIEKLTSPPVLAYADYSKDFILNIDASGDGLGAVLYQETDVIEHVIAYASRGLRANEWNYPAPKLAFLALKWAVTDKFHDYLYGNKFQVRTDNNPLTYVLTTAKLDATRHRWLASLSNYNFKLLYRSGRKNQDADALSRFPSADKEVLFNGAIKAIRQSVLASSDKAPAVESVLLAQDASIGSDEVGSDIGSDISQVDWQAEQTMDSTLNRVIQLLTSGHKPTKRQIAIES